MKKRGRGHLWEACAEPFVELVFEAVCPLAGAEGVEVGVLVWGLDVWQSVVG